MRVIISCNIRSQRKHSRQSWIKSAIDRFGQSVTAENYIQVSDPTDTTKLRFFADTTTLKVGEAAAVKLHSRLDKAIALLTIEGEEVLEYRVLELNKDYNAVPLTISHEHFPNFMLAVAAIDLVSRGPFALVGHTGDRPAIVTRALAVAQHTIQLFVMLFDLPRPVVVEQLQAVKQLATGQLGRTGKQAAGIAVLTDGQLGQGTVQTAEIVDMRRTSRREITFLGEIRPLAEADTFDRSPRRPGPSATAGAGNPPRRASSLRPCRGLPW